MMMEDFASVIGKNELEDGKEFKYNGSYEDIACMTSAIQGFTGAGLSFIAAAVCFNFTNLRFAA